MAGWINELLREHKKRKSEKELLLRVTEHVVDVADPFIRQARGYKKVLRPPVEKAMDYCRTLIEGIPGPFTLNKGRYHADPMVKALFASPAELEEVINISPEIIKLRHKGFSGEVTALLTAMRQEKTIYGYQKEKDVILRDVPQQAVSFFDHRIVAPADNLLAAKSRIVDRGVEVLAMVAMERITTLKSRKAELREKREYLKGIMKILIGKSHMLEMFAYPDPGKLEEYRKAEKLLAEVEEELAQLQEQMTYPKHSLGYLEETMQSPGNSLVLRHKTFRLNWMGVRVEDHPEIEGDEITMAEFSVGEEITRSAVLVSFVV